MKKYLAPITAALLLVACATHTSESPSNAEITPTMRLGKVVSKETIITQTRHSSPIDVGIGVGGGGNIGWGLSVGLGQLLSLWKTNEITYQYKIKMNDSETIMMQSKQNYDVDACLTVQEMANNKKYPKFEVNAKCVLLVQNTTSKR